MDLITFAAGTTWPKVMSTPQGADSLYFDWTWAGSATPVAGSRLFFRESWA
jgi:hypothetical protein